MSELLIDEIEKKVEALILRHQQLFSAYQALSEREAALITERSQLIEKNEIARARIEAMIPRMKQLEAATE